MTYKLTPFFDVLLYLFTGQIRSILGVFLLYSYSFLASYPGSAIMYNINGKEKTEEEDVKGSISYCLVH
jgi:hypothetical protein